MTFKLLFLTALFSAIFNLSFGQTKVDTLKNSTIIKLTKSKLQESVIIQKINQSVCNFDVSVDALIELKENLVKDTVINVMIQKQTYIDASTRSMVNNNKTDQNYVFSESGIYFLRNNEYINLDATIVSTTNPKAGMFNVKYKSQIEGGEANYQLTEKKPTFYFNFEASKKNLNDANANTTSENKGNYFDQLFNKVGYGNSNSNYQAVSPNDFKLIKLEKGKKKREFTSGKINSLGRMDMSIDSKNLVDFKYEKVSKYTFKIIFPKDLAPGEYCFMYLGNNNNAPYMELYGQNNFKVFDFSVKY